MCRQDSNCLAVLCESAPATKEGTPAPPIAKLLGFMAPGVAPEVQVLPCSSQRSAVDIMLRFRFMRPTASCAQPATKTTAACSSISRRLISHTIPFYIMPNIHVSEETLVKRLYPDDPKIPIKPHIVAAVCQALTALAASKVRHKQHR